MGNKEAASGEKLYQMRKAKLDEQAAAGRIRYPNDFSPTHAAATLAQAEPDSTPVRVAGRIMLIRQMGKSAFATLADASGHIQLHAAVAEDGCRDCLDRLGELDLGDIVGATGSLFRTRRGELTIALTELRLLAKCLRPPPEKHKGLVDPELRSRKRHLALMSDPAERQRFRKRSAIIASLRAFFDERGYLEVETPMMHPIAGGAAARPFCTRHNSLDMQLYLRIAPELYLKRLLVGGYERVYEINRSFRNEGVSTRHNPEFTMLEFYAAYRRHTDMMDLTEELFAQLAERFADDGRVEWLGHSINLASGWRRIGLIDAIAEYNGLSPEQARDEQVLTERLAGFAGDKAAAAAAGRPSLGQLQMLLFDKTVAGKLIDPTFVTDFPASVSPLARRADDDPEIAERFELYIGGCEMANGFSELNDPAIQAQVFRAQAAAAAAGDEEAMHYDADYIEALEAAMPPAAGEGIGIDRLVMLMLGCSSIREVMLFPLVRPAAEKAG
ncbi:MAG: lysine--tRNA ligase [Betaproteobacteria bacterium]|nr:lysine--tRNA ligase [Betaproteobacteria bacterium]